VQCLANPLYLQEIYNKNYFEQQEFINYLKYLQYFKEPKYARYL
jgi:mediator of RNA polymerase II transcription subunit 31